MLGFWQKRRERQARARVLAEEALAEARAPHWYTDHAVPDTFDGRFEVAVLALFLRLYRTDPALSQPAFTAFFRRMELSLRELGVGDLGVPRHMKRMMTGFNGRVRRYWQAAEVQDRDAMIVALTRNVYGTAPDTPPEKIEKLAADVFKRLEDKGGAHEIAAR